MSEIHWDAAAQVHERDDAGSDMFYEFKTLKTGTLAELVAWVIALPVDQKARVVIDAADAGSLNIHDITALAARPDYPGA